MSSRTAVSAMNQGIRHGLQRNRWRVHALETPLLFWLNETNTTSCTRLDIDIHRYHTMINTTVLPHVQHSLVIPPINVMSHSASIPDGVLLTLITISRRHDHLLRLITCHGMSLFAASSRAVFCPPQALSIFCQPSPSFPIHSHSQRPSPSLSSNPSLIPPPPCDNSLAYDNLISPLNLNPHRCHLVLLGASSISLANSS